MSAATNHTTTDRERWRAEARDLVLRCVPNADPARINVAVHQIVDQLDSVWRGKRTCRERI